MPQISATVPQETVDEVNKIAASSQRTFSQMVAILLEKAIKEKNRKKINNQ